MAILGMTGERTYGGRLNDCCGGLHGYHGSLYGDWRQDRLNRRCNLHWHDHRRRGYGDGGLGGNERYGLATEYAGKSIGVPG